MGITNIITVGLQRERIHEQHSGEIIMKWKVDKLLNDWYKFEVKLQLSQNLFNSITLTVDCYTWYKYDVGDTFNWTESYWDYPDDIWIWW